MVYKNLLIMLLAGISYELMAIKVIERKLIRRAIPESECIDGVLANPHCKEKKVCANRAQLAASFVGSDLQTIFTLIYERNYGLGNFSRSGISSNLAATATIRSELYPLCVQLRVKKVLDIGCGDFYWMQTIDFGQIEYIGLDIVPQMVALNRKHFTSETSSFVCADATCDALPQADIILCRDLLTELCYDDALAVVRNCKASGARYLLATNHPLVTSNKDSQSGLHRQYNLMLPPFNLPDPIITINEQSDNPQSWIETKELALWDLDELAV